MNFFVDLRLFVPLLLNIISFLFLKPQGQDVYLQILQHPFLFLLFLILGLLLLLLIIFTPKTLTLVLRAPAFMDSADYSVLLALSILASFILQLSLFTVVYVFLIIISPSFSHLWSLFQRFFNHLRYTPQSVSTTWINSDAAPDPVEGIENTEVEANHLMQTQPVLEEVGLNA